MTEKQTNNFNNVKYSNINEEHTCLNSSDFLKYATRLKILMIWIIISRQLFKQGFLYHKLRKTFAIFLTGILS